MEHGPCKVQIHKQDSSACKRNGGEKRIPGKTSEKPWESKEEVNRNDFLFQPIKEPEGIK